MGAHSVHVARAVFLLSLWKYCNASCYFPIELQGEFVMQSSVVRSNAHVQYSKVSITADSIPIWGRCYKWIGKSVMLIDSSGETNCIRCFHLKLHARNILEVQTEGLDKCYTNEDAARETCPNSESMRVRNSKQILLYKTHEYGGKAVQHEYCPISGRFTYTYNVNDGQEDKLECPNSVSVLDNCPHGSELNLRFRECTFENHDIIFKCLGHWVGAENHHYLALIDTRMGEQTPQYRCAIYHEETGSGKINLAFSSDSTCTANLYSSTNGYEVLLLSAISQRSWPELVTNSSCRFPAWVQGHWEHLYIEGGIMTFKDHVRLKTYTMQCLGSNFSTEERFPVFTRTNCGEELYQCIWIKRRGINVLEFQMGGESRFVNNVSLCADAKFLGKQWITQGRLERLQESPCPVTGEYTGYIPDASGLCAKLSSDCKSPEIMHYTVSDCSGMDIYEGRQYRCMGQWKENGFMYTYTQRTDVGSFECFVGSIASETEIFIKEAGSHCQRDVDPLHFGMKLVKLGPCFGNQPSTRKSTQSPYTVRSNKYRPNPEPTKPWKPITAPPKHINSGHIYLEPSKLLFAFGSVLVLFQQMPLR